MKTTSRGRPNEVRLIGGQWKRSKLPVAERPGLRPTPDRVRETLFNWLGQDLTGWRVLDAFAGSGALGFEAASRGARQVLLLEQDARLVASLNASAQRLGASGLEARRGDAMAWMASAPPAAWELVLLDPPFDAALAPAAARLAAALVVPGGFVYVESGEPIAEPPPGLESHRQGQAGAVCFQLFRRGYTAPVSS
ncbi:16S rRNA (guanine(966)-N(2))-methyltransferase RsmD [Rubrivivax gelatinosus]|uniref:16S rRNA (Guanine(966)-N(2))-methyltransferase RsmD n=1 Tax=Rubrivivax gelatinosus TaxID=28068 RepID=A0ABS1DXU5_RUBGE|nr:16S rRNA (guanine(966)-N(2))-methyltransferase RsmD [Rubrivivax gelatinosus]MBK1714475.1 16S rRNA (guanine(966)-N(2))-methyltransferase RsmD [Rubrivivax gelatinosus]